MNQESCQILTKMNIKSDVLVVNQCGHVAYHSWTRDGHSVEWYDFAERGVGLSRNNALLRAHGDILLFADDDVRYFEDCSAVILDEFRRYPMADVIIFNVISTCPERPEFMNQKRRRLHFFNSLKYGTFRMAVRREKIVKHNLSFHMMFGGGAKYGSGEDTIFLTDCFMRGLKVYASNQVIGQVSHNTSTWFHGITRTYFKDKGALFACISKRWTFFLCLQYCLRHPEVLTEYSLGEALRLMMTGAAEFKSL